MTAIYLLVLLAGSLRCLAQTGQIEVWAVPSVYKVRPDEPSQAHNLVWDRQTKTVSVSGAKNEHIPFQLVVSVPPPPHRSYPAPSGFFVEVTDLAGNQGRISRDQIKLYLEHVVLCYGKSSPVGETGFFPDALAPLTDPFNMAAGFKQFVKNRGLWIDVVTTTNTAAGDYSGWVRVSRNNALVDELKLKVKVYNFALPEETHLITYMGASSSQLAVQHNLPSGSPAIKDLLLKYHAFLYAHRMEPWFNEPLHPQIEVVGDQVKLQFNEQVYELYMNRWKTKRVILESVPRQLGGNSRPGEMSKQAIARIQSYLKQVVNFYKSKGWLEKLIFNSPIDEPGTAEAYEDTRRWATLVHEAAPGVPFLVTDSPVPRRPEWGTLTGYVNNFSIHGNALNQLAVKEAIPAEQAKGGEITWYISCDQGYPQPNYFIDGPAMDPVMVPWITWRYGMNGILYWDLKFWSQTPDPWIDPVTYLSGFLCSGGYILNGEGSLIYPGSKVRHYTGQKDVDGPVSSIRLELLREGIEDYEYLWLLKSLGDAKFADDAVKSMVVDVSAFSRNAAELFAIREKLARRIEELTRRRVL